MKADQQKKTDSRAARATRDQQVAVVVSTVHDRARRLLIPIVQKAVTLLEDHGYEVLQYSGKEATAASILVDLFELRDRGLGAIVGFFSAHGSERGLHGAGRELLVDFTMCEHLEGSVLVLAACLPGGVFPEECLRRERSPSAFVGVRGMLWCPQPKFWTKLLSPVLSRQARKGFGECLLLPLYLLLNHRSVKESITKAQGMWKDWADQLRPRDRRVAMVFRSNGSRLQHWGEGSAKV
jgi:hypothetical protein